MAGDQGAGGGLSGPIIALIAAVARNGAIGAGNALPWRLPTDLRRFQRLTMGKPIVMGRKTFESIGRPLPGRETIVVTRDSRWSYPSVAVAHGVEAAIRLAGAREQAEIIIGGGAEIYAQTIERADKLYITEVNLSPKGESYFPEISSGLWREVRRQPGLRGPRDEADFVFVDYERRVGDF